MASERVAPDDTGVVKLARPALDGSFPICTWTGYTWAFIYDIGFQSPNVEAAKPWSVTTLLLILIVPP